MSKSLVVIIYIYNNRGVRGSYIDVLKDINVWDFIEDGDKVWRFC